MRSVGPQTTFNYFIGFGEESVINDETIVTLVSEYDTRTPGDWDIGVAGNSGVRLVAPLKYRTYAEFSPVPVPAAVWLFGSGLLGMVGVARRKQTA